MEVLCALKSESFLNANSRFLFKCFVTGKRLCVFVAKYYVWSDICIELDRNSDVSFDAVTQGILDATSPECFMT